MAIAPDPLRLHFEKKGLAPRDQEDRNRELRVAQKLDGALDINAAAAHGGCSIWLTRLNEQLEKRFGIHREVAVIYSRHARVERRTIDSLRTFLHQKQYADRPDRNLAFVFHDARDAGAAAKECAGVGDWLLVPVTNASILAASNPIEFLRRNISSRLHPADLFGMSSPLKLDGYFFGRNDLVHDIISEGELGSNNHGIFGLRKTGKTSVLYAVMRRLESRPVLALYFELASMGYTQLRWWAFLEHIADSCAKALGVDDIPGRSRYEMERAGISFREDMERLLAMDKVQQIVLLFDEIDHITPGLVRPWGVHWEGDFEPFWLTIRGAHQQHQGKIRFIVAGVSPRCIAASSFGASSNPIFQGATQHLLPPFSRAQVEEMAETIGKVAGVSFNTGAFDLLLDSCAGFPYLTRLACSVVARNVEDPGLDLHMVDRAEFARHIEQIDAMLTDPIKDVLNSFLWWFPSVDYDLLEAWATRDKELISLYERQHPVEVERLRLWGMVKKDKLAIPRMADFLLSSGQEYREKVESFTVSDISIEKLAEPQDLDAIGNLNRIRSSLEIKLRHLIFNTLRMRCKYDDQELAQVLAAGMRQMKYSGGRSRDNRAMFIGVRPQDAMRGLFISDLGEIIRNHWDDFQAFFGVAQATFVEHFNIVKRARNDEAHLHEIPADDLSLYLLNYDWFRARLSGVPLEDAFDPVKLAPKG